MSTLLKSDTTTEDIRVQTSVGTNEDNFWEQDHSELDNLTQYFECRKEDWRRAYVTRYPTQLADVSRLLTELNLACLGLTRMPTQEMLSTFPNLQSLWLQGNRITCLGHSLLACTHLVNLRLGHNAIRSVNNELRRLHCLRTLDLSNNQLFDLQNFLTETRSIHGLKELDLSGNMLTQNSSYKHHILTAHPQLHVLDRQFVEFTEKKKARIEMMKIERLVLRAVAFGCNWQTTRNNLACVPTCKSPAGDLWKSNRTVFRKDTRNNKTMITWKYVDWTRVSRSNGWPDLTKDFNKRIVTVNVAF
ncbi:hypothetical protein P879_03252 [Paragonimus westermani]|uniref:Uncharacterized protein n=1 Tax=Paragonimus westermani TaxID=34504 RepID=A0A8T0CZZ4_9TREM|nr:hypothetical protein P879_03252 [Paragonimus westermani]